MNMTKYFDAALSSSDNSTVIQNNIDEMLTQIAPTIMTSEGRYLLYREFDLENK